MPWTKAQSGNPRDRPRKGRSLMDILRTVSNTRAESGLARKRALAGPDPIEVAVRLSALLMSATGSSPTASCAHIMSTNIRRAPNVTSRDRPGAVVVPLAFGGSRQVMLHPPSPSHC